MYETEGPNGETILQMMSMDIELQNDISYSLKIASMILLEFLVVLPMLILLTKLLMWIGRKILKKRRYKKIQY